jgi:small-conductance mechanosensitive channel
MDVVGLALPVARGIALIVGAHLAGRYLRGAIDKLLAERVDPTVRVFLASAVYPLCLALAVPAALEQLGVSVTSIIALLSTVGLAIAIGLKDSLSNVASGALLLTTRPFGVGDVVTVAGITGRVRRIGVLTTEIDADDGRRVSITNDKVLAVPMEQHASQGSTRVEIVLRVGRSHVTDALLARILDVATSSAPEASGHLVLPLDYDGEFARIAVRAMVPPAAQPAVRTRMFVALAPVAPSTPPPPP